MQPQANYLAPHRMFERAAKPRASEEDIPFHPLPFSRQASAAPQVLIGQLVESDALGLNAITVGDVRPAAILRFMMQLAFSIFETVSMIGKIGAHDWGDSFDDKDSFADKAYWEITAVFGRKILRFECNQQVGLKRIQVLPPKHHIGPMRDNTIRRAGYLVSLDGGHAIAAAADKLAKAKMLEAYEYHPADSGLLHTLYRAPAGQGQLVPEFLIGARRGEEAASLYLQDLSTLESPRDFMCAAMTDDDVRPVVTGYARQREWIATLRKDWSAGDEIESAETLTDQSVKKLVAEKVLAILSSIAIGLGEADPERDSYPLLRDGKFHTAFTELLSSHLRVDPYDQPLFLKNLAAVLLQANELAAKTERRIENGWFRLESNMDDIDMSLKASPKTIAKPRSRAATSDFYPT